MSILLPDSIINYIVSFIIKETDTSVIIKQYNIDIKNNFVCFNCIKEIRKKIYLTCSNNHHNCWKCLKIKLRQRDITCYGCFFNFHCLKDEIIHIHSKIYTYSV